MLKRLGFLPWTCPGCGRRARLHVTRLRPPLGRRWRLAATSGGHGHPRYPRC